MTPFQCQLKQARCKQMHMLVKLGGLPSASCTSSCCLTQMEKETLPEFVVANMLIPVSSIDNTHPATWQWVTMRSKVLASLLTESCVFFCVCCTYACVCVYACAHCLPVCSVCASVSVSITVSGWAGNGRMKIMVVGCHTHTSLSVCYCVSLSHQCVVTCGSLWDFCLRTGLDSIVLSTLFQVRCIHNAASGHVLCWHDSLLWLGCTLGALHLLHAVLSPQTHGVLGGYMSMSHRKNSWHC